MKHVRYSRVSAARAGQGPVLARNDPLNIFGNQREHALLIAAAYCRKKIRHNLDVLFDAHRDLSIFIRSDKFQRDSSHTTVIFRFLSQLDLRSPH